MWYWDACSLAELLQCAINFHVLWSVCYKMGHDLCYLWCVISYLSLNKLLATCEMDAQLELTTNMSSFCLYYIQPLHTGYVPPYGEQTITMFMSANLVGIILKIISICAWVCMYVRLMPTSNFVVNESKQHFTLLFCKIYPPPVHNKEFVIFVFDTTVCSKHHHFHCLSSVAPPTGLGSKGSKVQIGTRHHDFSSSFCLLSFILLFLPI